jgi:hypothetical protein
MVPGQSPSAWMNCWPPDFALQRPGKALQSHQPTISHRQMSMPKPVRARARRPPFPSARRGPRRRRSSTSGCSSWTRNHPQPAAVLPECAARKVSALVWRAHIAGTYAASGPESATWKDPDPRRRGSRDQGAQNRPACPAMAATRRLRPVRLDDFLALWSQTHMPSCNRQVTSASVHMAKPGPASVPRGHAPL